LEAFGEVFQGLVPSFQVESGKLGVRRGLVTKLLSILKGGSDVRDVTTPDRLRSLPGGEFLRIAFLVFYRRGRRFGPASGPRLRSRRFPGQEKLLERPTDRLIKKSKTLDCVPG
jgi:hypothetical protein